MRVAYTDLGNMVANYVETTHVCVDCKGSGQKVVDRDKLVESMEALPFHKAIYMYRQWKAYVGKVDCPNCDGYGYFMDRS
jgi:DnaJ-class molecular chaperone